MCAWLLELVDGFRWFSTGFRIYFRACCLCAARAIQNSERIRFVPQIFGPASTMDGRPPPSSIWFEDGSSGTGPQIVVFLLFPAQSARQPHREAFVICLAGPEGLALGPQITPDRASLALASVSFAALPARIFVGCVFEVWPAPGAREGLRKGGGPRSTEQR